MTVRQRLAPSDDHLCGRDVRRANVPIAYDWLKPCESPLEYAQRDGPVRPGIRLRASASFAAELPLLASSVSSGLVAAKKGAPRGKRGKPHDHNLRAAGNPGPLWQPPSEDELLYRASVTSAVRAAAATRREGPPRATPGFSRSASVPVPRARRRAEAAASAGAVDTAGNRGHQQVNAEDIEAWDSVSQAPTNYACESEFDVMSAETMSESRLKLPLASRLDRDTADHMARNRGGWYDWHAGRLIG
eukprot:TRINITY_DN74681_c0_g1_i1.p1 TRINITY_DN74681_c0_g1~~TRINITY_DN74681_c0_g1_i1.p1  ORF type:complete len:246 (+),score=33.39 TRINITY_DN74681_c0_g1_i1:86-823(+)